MFTKNHGTMRRMLFLHTHKIRSLALFPCWVSGFCLSLREALMDSMNSSWLLFLGLCAAYFKALLKVFCSHLRLFCTFLLRNSLESSIVSFSTETCGQEVPARAPVIVRIYGEFLSSSSSCETGEAAQRPLLTSHHMFMFIANCKSPHGFICFFRKWHISLSVNTPPPLCCGCHHDVSRTTRGFRPMKPILDGGQTSRRHPDLGN